MDGDWDEVTRLLLPPHGPQALPSPIASMAFDNSQELLWVGNQKGRVTSFYGADLQSYTSFKANIDPPVDPMIDPTPGAPVKQLLMHEKGVIALSPRSVHMASRKGPPLWHIENEDMINLCCMSFTSRQTSEILVAGYQDQLFIIDVAKGQVTKQIPTVENYTILRASRFICAATKHGTVDILDPTSFRVVKTWNAHSAMVNDMDAQHDFIVTCGYSNRQGQAFMLDPLVNVFDLKNMVSLPPIPFPSGAAFVRMHPRMLTTSIVTSHVGQIHVVDIMNVNTSNIKHANVTVFLTGMEIAPSGEAMTLSSGDSNVLLWGSPSRIRFSELSNPVEFADNEDQHAHLDWNLDSPLSTIGMPYYREQLLSAWPGHLISDVGAPPQKIDPQILANLVYSEYFGSYTYPPSSKPKFRRNMVQNTRTVDNSSASLQAPKFLSERAREASSPNPSSDERRIIDVADAVGAMDLSTMKTDMPMMYRSVEIKYSKFGVDDFDFGFYNKTKFSGLEIHISNAYANSLLQVLNFTPVIRNLALQHTATSCVNPMCLLCELGFLFDMLEKAEGSICQATNLLKMLSNHPQAGPLGLLEEEQPGTPLSLMLQGLNRFLCDAMVQNYRSIPPHSSKMDQMLATSATTSIKCMNCRSEHTSPGNTLVNELTYPAPKSTARNARIPKVKFSHILKSSVERDSVSRGWCSRCQRYQNLATRKTIHNVPDVLLLNAAVKSPEAKQLWGTLGWLPDEIGVIVEHGQFYCFEGDDLKLHLERGTHNVIVYSLTGLVCDVDSGQHQRSHLVSLINVAHTQPTPQIEPNWHLFNDFLVRAVEKNEALSCNTTWKLPSVLAYQVKAANNVIDNSWKLQLETSLLYVENNVNSGPKTYQTLVPDQEIPGPDSIVAIDTEFVAIRQPEIEINSDGERATIRPIVYALARVSAIRGDSKTFIPTLEQGTPFIDDYITTTEPIVDYLTSYSGIVAGDLDPRTSTRNLVPLKLTYKKIWLLLNLGVSFLGHGLRQDFRVINIHVPKAQVIDTAEFFFLAARLRKLSLAFLAWYLLKEDIQQETHDSIEDARTALKLYKKYLEFVDAGIMETMLQDIYARGRDVGFKPPQKGIEGGTTSMPATPAKKAGGLGMGSGSEGWTPGKSSTGTPSRGLIEGS